MNKPRKVDQLHDAFCECRKCCLMWEGIEHSVQEGAIYDDDQDIEPDNTLEQWAREIANE